MMVPPPTPNRPLNAPAACRSREPTSRDRGAYYGACSAHRPNSRGPAPCATTPGAPAVFCDIDGTLAPIVERAEDAHVPEKTSRLLARWRAATARGLHLRTPATEARRLVGVGGIAYAGSHGAELLEPGARNPRWCPRSPPGRAGSRVRARARHAGAALAAACGSRTRARSWPSTGAARRTRRPRAPASRDRRRRRRPPGLLSHWGRKVLEVRPPVPVDKGRAVQELVRRSGVRNAMFGGDDATDLDGFEALDARCGRGGARPHPAGRGALGGGPARDRGARRPRGGRAWRASRRCSRRWPRS